MGLLQIGLVLLDIGRSVVAGERADPLEVARSIAAVAVQLAPVDQLKGFLDEAARLRAELAADAAEDAKFPR